MDQLTNTERLLLAQAVYQEGANDWSKVSQIISNHPLIGRPKSYFSPSTCSSIYTSMIHAAGLDSMGKDNARPRADVNRKLAEVHYTARVTELRDLIFQEETRFKTVLTEIDEIRSGLWDGRIKASLGIVSQEPAPEAPIAQDVPEVLEEPTNEVEDVSMIDAEPPRQQDEPIIIDDSDATTDEPLVTQQVSQAMEEEEVDLHLTPNSVPPSPKPTKGVVTVQEDVEVGNEEPAQPVHQEVEPQSPFTEQGLEEQDAEDMAKPDETPTLPAPPEMAPADDEPEQEEAQEAVTSEKDEPETGVQARRGKRKAEVEADPKREKKKSREISEPLEESEPEPAPTKKRRVTTSEGTSRAFQNVISLLHDQICQLRNGSIFHGPVKVSDAPDYYEIVKRPIDLKAIKTRIRDGQITNSLEYQRDIFLMFANSMMYNRPDSDLYKMAEEMMLESEQLINQFRQTESWNQ
ncbi:hypothetical protein BDM02DRAFT_3183943 [Thelephora ganbajun]|uniref:Uncharacterized protein n=1 Tax=Thelephora ganbajun TaxID=370292 RepID=A0ACB6ZRM9_THEGA|nr:hypothetical protein BDM02DRAFT_3183943 [Thelephora ganbajun]